MSACRRRPLTTSNQRHLPSRPLLTNRCPAWVASSGRSANPIRRWLTDCSPGMTLSRRMMGWSLRRPRRRHPTVRLTCPMRSHSTSRLKRRSRSALRTKSWQHREWRQSRPLWTSPRSSRLLPSRRCCRSPSRSRLGCSSHMPSSWVCRASEISRWTRCYRRRPQTPGRASSASGPSRRIRLNCPAPMTRRWPRHRLRHRSLRRHRNKSPPVNRLLCRRPCHRPLKLRRSQTHHQRLWQ
jgi:hypothetical protein